MSRYIHCELCDKIVHEDNADKWVRVTCNGDDLDYCPKCGPIVDHTLRNRSEYLDKLTMLNDEVLKLVDAVMDWVIGEHNIVSPPKHRRDSDLLHAAEEFYSRHQEIVADLAKEAKE